MSDRLREARAELARMRAERDAAPSLFDDDVDAAVSSVLDHEGEAWKARALEAVRRAAIANGSITVVDVWARMRDPTCLDRRAMGGVMRVARDRGWIAPTHQYRRHPDRAAHGRPLQVWRSRIAEYDDGSSFDFRVPGGRPMP